MLAFSNGLKQLEAWLPFGKPTTTSLGTTLLGAVSQVPAARPEPPQGPSKRVPTFSFGVGFAEMS